MTYTRGQHPNSLKNLEKGRFQKGQVSNPHGRPRKEFSVTSILQEKLNQPCDKDPSVTWAEWLAKRALELAGENPAYYRELMDRTEGRVPQALDARIAQEEDVQVHFVIGRGYVSKEEFNRQLIDPRLEPLLAPAKQIEQEATIVEGEASQPDKSFLE